MTLNLLLISIFWDYDKPILMIGIRIPGIESIPGISILWMYNTNTKHTIHKSCNFGRN